MLSFMLSNVSGFFSDIREQGFNVSPSSIVTYQTKTQKITQFVINLDNIVSFPVGKIAKKNSVKECV